MIRRASRRARLLVGWLVAAAAVPVAPVQAAAAAFEYLYVEPNSGESSGGHAAIRFGDFCYHFQQTERGTILLHKDDYAQFEHTYRVSGNRTIHAARVEVSRATYDRLQEAFAARYRVQRSQVDTLDALSRDRKLFEWLLARQQNQAAAVPDTGVVPLPGSAYFFADETPAPPPIATSGEGSETLASLAGIVAKTYGEDFLDRRAAELRAEIAWLSPADDAVRVAPPELGKAQNVPAGIATRYAELLNGLLAIEVLQTARPLQKGSVLTSPDIGFQLRPKEVQEMRARAARLRASLVRLLESKRPDWGYPMLVGIARLTAMQASIRSGRLVLLDVFPTRPATVSAQRVRQHANMLSLLLADRRREFRQARDAFFRPGADGEVDLSLLETTGNLVVELERALEQHASMRVHPGNLTPEKSAFRPDWPAPECGTTSLEQALVFARSRQQSYAAALERLYRYDLVSRNCVTEIFRTIESAFAAGEEDSRPGDETRQAMIEDLGGYVAVTGTLNFIPFVSAESVESAYRVSAIIDRPSYRRVALAQRKARRNPLRVDLRESNVLTSTIYERNEDDPFFLFFTDQTVWGRPLLGLANLAVGVGATVTGVVLLPLDAGATLREGLDGVMFSLPELVFVNIRKGSYPFAPYSLLAEPVRASE